MNLGQYAQRVVETKGLVHQSNLRALRIYLTTQLEERLLGEIEDIRSARQLRALWEAGLNIRLQDAVLKQLKKVK